MEKVNVIDCQCRLRDCGFSVAQAMEYVELIDSGRIEERISFLKRKRNEALKVLHAASKQIDCIDYCIYELEKNKKEQ